MPALPLTVLRHSPTINVGRFTPFGRSNMAYFYGEAGASSRSFKRLHGRIAVSGAAREFVGAAVPRRVPDHPERHRLRIGSRRRLEPHRRASRTTAWTCCSSGGWRSARGSSICCAPGRACIAAVPQARLIVVGRWAPARKVPSWVDGARLARGPFRRARLAGRPGALLPDVGRVLRAVDRAGELRHRAAGGDGGRAADRGVAHPRLRRGAGATAREGLLVPPKDSAALAAA